MLAGGSSPSAGALWSLVSILSHQRRTKNRGKIHAESHREKKAGLALFARAEGAPSFSSRSPRGICERERKATGSRPASASARPSCGGSWRSGEDPSGTSFLLVDRKTNRVSVPLLRRRREQEEERRGGRGDFLAPDASLRATTAADGSRENNWLRRWSYTHSHTRSPSLSTTLVPSFPLPPFVGRWGRGSAPSKADRGCQPHPAAAARSSAHPLALGHRGQRARARARAMAAGGNIFFWRKSRREE